MFAYFILIDISSPAKIQVSIRFTDLIYFVFEFLKVEIIYLIAVIIIVIVIKKNVFNNTPLLFNEFFKNIIEHEYLAIFKRNLQAISCFLLNLSSKQKTYLSCIDAENLFVTRRN
jgi:hypothetical protein